MSGIEVAGLVLGSIPLVISTLEHYKDGLSTIQRWRQYEREVRILVRNLKTEHVRIQNICEKLLGDLVPPSKIESLIENPNGPLWKERDIQKKVRLRLWRSADIFESTLRDLQASMEKLKKQVDSQCDGSASSFRRAVFTLSRSQYQDLLDSIKDDVGSLESLVNGSCELEIPRRLRSQGRYFLLLQKLAYRLYQVLKSNLHCPCGYGFGWYLEPRTSDIIPTDDDEKALLGTEYACPIIRLSKDEDTHMNGGRPHDTIPNQFCASLVISESLSLNKKRASSEVSSSNNPTKTKKKSVRFAAAQKVEMSEVSPPTSSIEVNIHGGAHSQLCAMISILQTSPFALSQPCTLKDAVSCPHKSYTAVLSESPEHHGAVSKEIISLGSLLETTSQFPQVQWSKRIEFAVAIASTFLQLHGSPWLPKTLDSNSLLLLKDSNSIVFNGRLFVMTGNHSDNSSDTLALPPYVSNPALYSLGMLLIEVYENEKLPHATFSDDLRTAYRSLEQIQRMSLNYATAVKHCLSGELQDRNTGLSSEDYVHKVYTNVVALLEKDLENLRHLRV